MSPKFPNHLDRGYCLCQGAVEMGSSVTPGIVVCYMEVICSRVILLETMTDAKFALGDLVVQNVASI